MGSHAASGKVSDYQPPHSGVNTTCSITMKSLGVDDNTGENISIMRINLSANG